jgi:hypothetical protein
MLPPAKMIASAAAFVAFAACAVPALADVTLYQSSTLNPAALGEDNTFALQGDGTTAGDGFFGGSLFFGADFSVTQTVTISGIGAMFADTAQQSQSGSQGNGSIFGAIVQVDPATGLPTQPVESLASIVLGHVVFTPVTDGDTTAPLSLVLQPGTYGVVFGSGLFGATGVADLLAGNNPVGSPSIFVNNFAPFAADPSDTDVRLFVNAVPEPGSIAMLFTSGLMFAAARRRRG